MKLTLQTILVTLLLSACSNAAVQSTIPHTIKSTTTPQNIETPQPNRTPTLHPIKTPVSKKVIAITATYEAELSSEATVAAYGTICELPASDYYAQISPDSQWIAMACKGVDGGINSYLQVVSIQGNKKWSIHYVDYAKGAPYGRRNMISPTHWSMDGKYLYVTSEDIGSGCCWIGWDVLLVRLNLENGLQTMIANYIGEGLDMNISFSPSERYALYIPQDGKNNLYIWDTQTTKQRVINLEDTKAGAGHALMSNDDKKIILVLRDYPKEQQGDLTFGSLVLINLMSGSQKKLLSDMDYDNMPLPFIWKDTDFVLLQQNKDFLLLHINTGELTKTENP